MGHPAAALIAPAAWDFACPDWEQRLRDGASLLPDLPLDEEEAARAVEMYDALRLPDVEGQPLLADAGGDWFRDCVRAIFGSLDRDTGVRAVPDTFLLVPKKNSKTTNSAALMLVALLMNRRPRAQFALFGPTQEVADLAFAAAAGMIDADDELREIFHVQDHLKTIRMRAGPGRDSKLKITTLDPKVATGGKYAGWLVDEAHLLGKVPHAGRVIGQLRGARVAVPEQFGLIITTQSDERPAGMFKTELDYARAIRDGRVQGAMLPLLYEFPESMQTDPAKPWRDPARWPMVLPNLGRSVNLSVLSKEYQAARDKGDVEEQRWASQHLNIEIGLALHSDRWVGVDHWPVAAEACDLGTLLATSDVCTVGVDGGGLDDLFGLAVMGRCATTAVWRCWVRAWAMPEVLDRRKEIAPALLDFAAQGDLVLCAGGTQDIDEAAAIIAQVKDAGLLPAQHGIGLDPYGIGALVDALKAAGIADEAMVAIGQGSRLSPAVWTLERKLRDRTFRPSTQAILDWCVGNARTEQRGNAVLITKETAGKAKIDPLVALFNAAMLMSRNPVAGSGATVIEAGYRLSA